MAVSVVGFAGAVAWGTLSSRGARPTDGRSPFQVPVPQTVRAEPRFFADLFGYGGEGTVEIRKSSSGRFVALLGAGPQPGLLRGGEVSAVTAVGARSLLIAVQRACSAQFARVQVTSQGDIGSVSPAGSALTGLVTSVAASANGQIVAYTLITPCAKGGHGYIGVLNLSDGQRRQWPQVSIEGVSLGRLGLQGPLSLSANGRLIGFAATANSSPFGDMTGEQVRILPTDSAPGSVASRSRVVLRPKALEAVALSPSGRSYYLCTAQAASARSATALIAAYAVGADKPYSVLATVTGPTNDLSGAGCRGMALDPSGGTLLVPYTDLARQVNTARGNTLVRIAVINTATRARSDIAIQYPRGAMTPGNLIGATW